MNKQNPKKAHHYIPRYYLKGFTESVDSENIWVYDKINKNVFSTRVSRVAFQNDYYTFTTVHGEKDRSHEDWLAEEIEGPAHKVIKKIRQHYRINELEKGIVARYIDVLLRRVPRSRERINKIYPGVIAEQITEIESGKLKVIKYETQKMLALSILEDYKKEHPNVIYLPHDSKMITKTLFNMTWRFLTFEGERGFITSDNPVCFPEGTGILRLDAEITVPISTNILLWLTWLPGPNQKFQEVEQDREYLEINQPLVDLLNWRTATVASRFLFYTSEEDWILDLENKRY